MKTPPPKRLETKLAVCSENFSQWQNLVDNINDETKASRMERFLDLPCFLELQCSSHECLVDVDGQHYHRHHQHNHRRDDDTGDDINNAETITMMFAWRQHGAKDVGVCFEADGHISRISFYYTDDDDDGDTRIEHRCRSHGLNDHEIEQLYEALVARSGS